jgi:hypothetical protein
MMHFSLDTLHDWSDTVRVRGGETMTLLYYQYLQAALATWRARNGWADSVPFEAFPSRYRDAIELAAHINMNKGEML